MKNWGNWSKSDLKKVIENAKNQGQSSVRIDQEHTDHYNDSAVNEWLAEMGLKFETHMESTTIHF